jgi:hypothetical protein
MAVVAEAVGLQEEVGSSVMSDYSMSVVRKQKRRSFRVITLR